MIAGLLLVLFGAAQRPAVEWKDDELWLTREGAPAVQLTSDGCPKGRELAWSPDGEKVAYYTIKTVDKPQCPSDVVLLAGDGTRLRTIPGLDRGNSVMRVDWLGNDRIGIDTHINPSVGQYRVVDATSGSQLASYFGYGFRPSADFEHVAHAGPMPHFAPAFAKNDYLMVDDRVIYPRSAEKEPNVRPSDPADNLLYRDIHGFWSGFTWSPDGTNIAFVARLFDWRADAFGSYDGKEENSRWWLVVVPAAGGEPALRRLPEPGPGAITVQWTGPARVKLDRGGLSGEYAVAR